MCSQGKQRYHSGRNGDHDRPQPQNARIDQSRFQVLTLFSSLFDELEEHDDVADDHTDETDDSKERHKPEWLSHYGERNHGPDDSIRNRRKYDQRLHRMFELRE